MDKQNNDSDNNANEQLDCFFETANSQFKLTQKEIDEILFNNDHDQQFTKAKDKVFTSQLDSLSLNDTPSTSQSTQLTKSTDDYLIRQRTIIQDSLSSFNANSDFLINNYQIIPTKSTKVKNNERHLNTVIQLQNFQADIGEIWVTRFSTEGLYIATGGKTGVVNIWEIINEEQSLLNLKKKGLVEYLKLVKETPFKTFKEHKNEIIDLNWSEMNPNLLISVSVDRLAILWDITKESSINIYSHNGMVSCIAFRPYDSSTPSSDKNELFATGCFDKIIRVWGVDNATPLAYVNVNELITAIAFFPQGNRIAVGNSKGKISIYEFNSKLKYSTSFDCKNKSGKYSNGRKITDISFINCTLALITTNDNRIRMINMFTKVLIHKFKGLKNEDTLMRASFDDLLNTVICPSLNGEICLWKCPEDNQLKNKCYELIIPFKDKEISMSSMFINPKAYSNYSNKVKMIASDIIINSIIINTSNKGRMQLLFNYDISFINFK